METAQDNTSRKQEEKVCLTNGWQNIGIMKQYAKKNIQFKLRALFMEIVEVSFGYGMAKTLHKTQEFWSKEFGISKPTFNSQINSLALNGHIRINHQKGYVVGGGSKSYSYSPSYPKNANIWIKSQSESKTEPDDVIDFKKMVEDEIF